MTPSHSHSCWDVCSVLYTRRRAVIFFKYLTRWRVLLRLLPFASYLPPGILCTSPPDTHVPSGKQPVGGRGTHTYSYQLQDANACINHQTDSLVLHLGRKSELLNLSNYLQSYLYQVFLHKLFLLMQSKWLSFYRPLGMVPSAFLLSQEIFILLFHSHTTTNVNYVMQKATIGSQVPRYRQPQYAEIKCSRGKKKDSMTCRNVCSFRESISALCIRQWRIQSKLSGSSVCSFKWEMRLSL